MSRPVDERSQMTDVDTGVFLVATATESTYRFDLDTGTVERVGGEPRRSAAPADVLQPLRGIIEVRVGRPGRWWMRNLSGAYACPGEVWQSSSTVASIEAACGDRSAVQR